MITQSIRTGFFLLLLLLTGVLPESQAQMTSSTRVIGIDLLKSRGETVIPFDLEQGFIIVDVWLGGFVPMKMIFDTGAENIILFDREIPILLGIPFERQIPVMGSDLDSVIMANIARNVMLRAEGCNQVLRDIIVLEENNLLLKEKLGIEVNGILGGGFFPNVVVKIDYRRKQITLRHPNKFKKPKGKYHEFDLEIRSNKPYLQAGLKVSDQRDSATSVRLLLDTGAALPFLIHANTDSTLTLPDSIMLGNVGFGLGGVIRGYMGRSRELDFSPFVYSNIATSFQDLNFGSGPRPKLIRNGILGNNLLSRFYIVIDYSREKLYLQASKKYNRDFEFDKSGITVFAVGSKLDKYYIVSVLEGSPAAEADVQPGDLIIKVNRRRSSNMRLQDITNMFSKKPGKNIKLTLIRGEEKIKREFVLREWTQVSDSSTTPK
ncbi:MAG: PDZ domain-containing protein [Bacteroidota bacterium]